MTDTSESRTPEHAELTTPVATGVVTSGSANEHEAAASPHHRVNKTLINFWLDAGMLVVLAVLGIVAVIVQFVFPPGVAARGWLLWGMTYGQWCSVQFIVLCVLSLAVLGE